MIGIEDLHGLFLQCSGACTDTRNITTDSMFFALKGPNFNANNFAAEAIAKGSSFAVVDDPNVATIDRILLVPDVIKTLQELATFHRSQFQIPVIGITGTNGKTTTKELIHAVLSSDRETLSTAGNLNNHIGVPLTLLRLNEEHQIAIIEMGANKRGDIKELAEIAEPTHGLITNIGKAHMEGFGSAQGVIDTKTELYDNIRDRNGMIFVNSDDELLMEKSEGIKRQTYGISERAESRGTDRTSGPFLSFSWEYNGIISTTVTTGLIGAYNLSNALAAVCIGGFFNVKDALIAEAIGSYAPNNNRSQFIETANNQLIMDAYNANPSSMKVALENFAAMKTDRKKLAILGDMLELGDTSGEEHLSIVNSIAGLSIKAHFVGPIFVQTAGAENADQDVASAKDRLHAMALRDHLILIKGSRGIKLETLVPVL
ncbi:MAG: UDP-N-acetylmuramoyl-tripeptide--D-alanyl-D-alanine ligase [Bacteroidota bacterium]|nr:UDP-N-acetylmuramoyl-tripeptide--D-alanyl-D-alanine ligase [Bacteroidota bacterium]